MRKIGRRPFISDAYDGDLEELDEIQDIKEAGLSITKDLSRRDFLKAMSAAGLLTAAGAATLGAGGTVLKDIDGTLAAEAEGSSATAAATAASPAANEFLYSGSTRMLDYFVQRGARHLFGVAGSMEAALYDSLVRDEYKDKLQYIQCGQEHAATQQAFGYAEATERAAVCLYHVGVGAPFSVPILNGVIAANVPLFMWTCGGSTRASDWNQTAFYSYGRITEMMEDYVKWHMKITSNANLDNIINRAFRVAETAPQGAVFVNQIGEYAQEELERSPLPPVDEPNLVSAEPGDVNLIADKLNMADNPWIVTTRAGRFKANVARLVELAEKLGAGVIESGSSHMNFPTNNPCHRGYSTSAARDADVVLVLDSFTSFAPVDAWVAHVLDNPIYLSYNADYTVFADSRSFLPALLKNTVPHPDREDRIAAHLEAHTEMRRGWVDRALARVGEYPPAIYEIWYEVNKVWDPSNNILLWAPGYQQTSRIREYVERTTPGSWYYNTLGAMGFIGAAIGVQLAEPNRRVVGAMGDWEVHQCDLWEHLYTCAHHKIPVVWMVLDNQSGATVRSSHWGYKQAIYHYANIGQPRYWTVELDEPRVDYTAMAASVGIPSLYVDTADEIGPALSQALARTNSSTLLAVNSQCYTTFTEGKSPERDRQ